MTLEEAWAIGILDGECWMGTLKTSRSARIQVAMTDLDVLQRLQKLWGGNIYVIDNAQTRRNPHWKKAWNLVIAKRNDIRSILRKAIPLLSIRRAYKAENILDYLDGVV